jgi:hypothetical protein
MSILYLNFGCITKCLYISTDILKYVLELIRGGEL